MERTFKNLNKFCFSLDKLTVNLSKSHFVKAKVVYLGHVIGLGVVSPIKEKVKSIIDYPIPENTKSLMRFLGMEGYYKTNVKNSQKSLLH